MEIENLNCQRVKPKDAAKVLGIGVPQIYMEMKRGTLPIGSAIPPTKGHKKYRYFIYKAKLMEYVGIKTQE